MWANLVDADNGINSNYGQYVFNTDKGIHYVIAELTKDKDSRRASIMILSNERLSLDSKDTPCTYSMNFRIRDNKLNMSVCMRSQDAIFGLGNDAPCFSFIHEMAFVLLKEVYPELELGKYNHTANSFHVYARHFEMLKSLCIPGAKFDQVDCPKISCADEARFMMSMHKINYDISQIPESYAFTRWLLGV